MADGETETLETAAQETEVASGQEVTETSETAGAAETAASESQNDPKELEEKIGGLLDKAFSSDNDEEAESADDSGTPQATDVTDKAAPKDGEADADEKDEQAGEAAASDETAPTLPAAYLRSLKSDGWSDEEIAEHAKLPNFTAIAGKIHDRRNAETARWAEAGRQVRQQQAAPQQQQQQTARTQAGSMLLKPVDAAALKAQYGDDALVDNLVAPVNAAIAQINAILPVVQQTQARSQQAEQAAVIHQVESFFAGKEMKSYSDVYGDAKSIGSNPEQQAARNKVLEMADALLVGASRQGRQLSLEEAMTLAHDSVSSGFKKQAVRAEIKKELKQRGKSLTLKPSNRGKTTAAEKGKGTLERRVQDKLNLAFT